MDSNIGGKGMILFFPFDSGGATLATGVFLAHVVPLIVLFMGLCGLVRLWGLKGELGEFRRMFLRSVAPVLAAVVITVGALGGWALRLRESSAMARVAGQEAGSLYQEIQRTHLQEWINGFYFNPAYCANAYSYVYALSKGQ